MAKKKGDEQMTDILKLHKDLDNWGTVGQWYLRMYKTLSSMPSTKNKTKKPLNKHNLEIII